VGRLILGNILDSVASLLLIYSGTLYERKKILLADMSRGFFSAFGRLILGSFTGFVSSTSTFVRNFLYYKEKLSLRNKLIVGFFTVFFSLRFGDISFLSLIPTVISISYLFFFDMEKIKNFKLLNVFYAVLWLIYKVYIRSYLSAFVEILVAVTNLIAVKKHSCYEEI